MKFYDGMYPVTTITIEGSGAATTAIAAAAAGKKYILDSFIISADANQQFRIKDGSTSLLGKTYFPANGGVSMSEMDMRGTLNTALNLETISAGEWTVWAKYYIIQTS